MGLNLDMYRGVTGWYRGTTWIIPGGPGNSPARHRKPTLLDRGNPGTNGECGGIRLLNREHSGTATGTLECKFIWSTNVSVHPRSTGIPASFHQELLGPEPCLWELSFNVQMVSDTISYTWFTVSDTISYTWFTVSDTISYTWFTVSNTISYTWFTVSDTISYTWFYQLLMLFLFSKGVYAHG